MIMDNFTVSVNLTRLKNAGFAELKGKTGQKNCIVIPVDDNPEIKVSSGEGYLNMVAFQKKESDQYGNTHLIKGSWPKELREKMTKEERFAQPIIGNMRPMGAESQQQDTGYESVSDDEDLPF